MKQQRRRGRRRPNARPVVLNDRDWQMLLFIGRMRYASRKQLARAFFSKDDTCYRRLRKLYDNKLLTITCVSSTHCFLYSLTSQSLTLLKDRFEHAATVRLLSGGIRLAGVRHHLTIVDAYLYVKILAEQSTGSLSHWYPAGSFERLAPLKLEPDGVAGWLVNPNKTLWLAIEADCGTETHTVIEHKLLRYREAIDSRLVKELWFVVDAGEGRARNIAEAARHAGLGNCVRVMSREHVIGRPVEKPPARVT